MSPPDVTAIDTLLRELQSLIERSLIEGSRLGYFGCLYTRVTVALRQAILNGEFADGEAVARLDVAFARRYLAAVAQHRSGDAAITRPWSLALDATRRADLSIVQHLALAFNAHVNFDLSVATFECFGAADLHSARADFTRVNDILESVVGEVEREIAQVSPVLRFIEGVSGALATKVIDFGLAEARAFAWRFAEILAATPAALRPALMADKAREVAFLCAAITQDPIRNGAFALIAAAEVKDVRRVIRALDRGLLPTEATTTTRSAPGWGRRWGLGARRSRV
ncbi:MAG TPA: DUF5995 family protein [Polyangia bacterium]|nr:DUF5995 family protein [Polyangia bacterium]